jgi:hypothetical protein
MSQVAATLFDTFDALEDPLDPVALFPVQKPDGRRDWTEIDRQTTFNGKLRMLAPSLECHANRNAGKRAGFIAIKEGVKAGVFDLTVASGMIGPRFVAWPEFKGYDKNGRPGTLSRAQIDWGNRMHRAGHHVACFFDPSAAVEWIRSISPHAFIDRRSV